ncbi:TetR/AcrR family transcriptional regulator [Sphingomonas sp. BAUL-RG-20F-R05-02]|uniref:TetR/AcrR family transcriptional regulator n=1 Tax=Sphingomonas sp. BAUL-RG-20F-R05-02 TaxID=2914830 RepID=UPI001F599B19|nr:TetR/AcrR family transcriptional regulator [Sphingomonas sp. BAUL-RG-20F-R05-02]
MKDLDIQRPAPRLPRQERAKQKIELILEAAMRLLDRGGMPMLTTNAIAETAGVSIGTLYQYFPDKNAVLDMLADRELTALCERVMTELQNRSAVLPQERLGRIIQAITASFGNRRRVHRLIIEYLLTGGARRMAPLIEEVLTWLASPDSSAPAPAINEADAFVLTNAFAGVMRAMIMRPDFSNITEAQIEEALGRMLSTFRTTTGR